MERSGDVEGALSVLLSYLIGKLDDLSVSYKNIKMQDLEEESAFPETQEEREVMDWLIIAIQLCERNAREFGKETRNEVLWLRILDTLMVPLTKVKQDHEEKNKKGFLFISFFIFLFFIFFCFYF